MHKSVWGVLSDILTSFVNFQIDSFELQKLPSLTFIEHFCKKIFRICFLKCSWIPTLICVKCWNTGLRSCISTVLALLFFLIFVDSFVTGFGSHQSSQMFWHLNMIEKPEQTPQRIRISMRNILDLQVTCFSWHLAK